MASKRETIRVEVHEAHCPGCRPPAVQGVDPLGVMEPQNPSHGTQSKTVEHIALRQWQAMLKAKEKKG